MSSSIAARTPRTAPFPLAPVAFSPSAVVAMATFPDSPVAEMLDPTVLARELLAARKQADAFCKQLRDATAASAAAAKVARLDLARAKLKALRLDAAFKVLMRDGRGARRVAEEAAEVAREIRNLGAVQAAPAVGPAAAQAGGGEDTTVAADSAAVAGAGNASDSDVTGLLQTVRVIIATAHRAARQGSPEDRDMERLRNQVGGAPSPVGIVGGGNLLPVAGIRAGFHLKV